MGVNFEKLVDFSQKAMKKQVQEKNERAFPKKAKPMGILGRNEARPLSKSVLVANSEGHESLRAALGITIANEISREKDSRSPFLKKSRNQNEKPANQNEEVFKGNNQGATGFSSVVQLAPESLKKSKEELRRRAIIESDPPSTLSNHNEGCFPKREELKDKKKSYKEAKEKNSTLASVSVQPKDKPFFDSALSPLSHSSSLAQTDLSTLELESEIRKTLERVASSSNKVFLSLSSQPPHKNKQEFFNKPHVIEIISILKSLL